MNSVFIFPGYGAQYVGMGKDFYDHYRSVQELFEEASNCLNINFVKLCFASSERELSKPLNAYLALFVVQASLYTALLEHGIEPSIITGWGVGYCSSYYAAGIINFPDGLYLLGKYLSFLDELLSDRPTPTIRVTGLTRSELEQLIKQQSFADSVVLGLIRAERECIVVGTAVAMAQLCAVLRENNKNFTEEPRAYTLHLLCRHEMIKRMDAYLAKIDCKSPRYPFLNHEGQYIAVGEPIVKSTLTRFMYEPIDVPKIVQRIISSDRIIQIGPGFLTPGMVESFLPQTKVTCILQRKDLKGLAV